MKFTNMGIGLLAGFAIAFPVSASSISDFYKGKQITHVVGYGSGGSYDTYSRLLDRHISRHIPGHPSVITQNMPGAGGRKAADWLYNIAPKDGTALATFSQNIPIDQALNRKGINFNVTKMNWIGNLFQSNNILVTWHSSGVKTIEDARQKEITIGGTGVNSPDTFYPRVVNNVLGTKFKIIAGYKGGSAIDLAMERGEVGGRGSTSWLVVKMQHPEWIRDKKINILFQVGSNKEPELPDVRLLSELGKTAKQRQILEFISANVMLGRPVITGPGVPSERVAALRKAFDETAKDPLLQADAKKLHMEVNPVSGEVLQKHVTSLIAMPAQVIDKVRTLSAKK